MHEMDEAFLSQANASEDQKKKTVSSRPLTPDLFMAKFG